MTIRILLDHGVLEEHIIFLTFLVARVGGIVALRRAFPKVRMITGAVDDNVQEIWRAEGDGGRKDWYAAHHSCSNLLTKQVTFDCLGQLCQDLEILVSLTSTMISVPLIMFSFTAENRYF